MSKTAGQTSQNATSAAQNTTSAAQNAASAVDTMGCYWLWSYCKPDGRGVGLGWQNHRWHS